MNISAAKKLDGKIVLVKSAVDRRNPPTALRGSLSVSAPSGGEAAEVKLTITYPDMFTAPAHQQVITLDESTVERLLAVRADEPFEITVDFDLEQESRGKSLVAPRAHQPK